MLRQVAALQNQGDREEGRGSYQEGYLGLAESSLKLLPHIDRLEARIPSSGPRRRDWEAGNRYLTRAAIRTVAPLHTVEPMHRAGFWPPGEPLGADRSRRSLFAASQDGAPAPRRPGHLVLLRRREGTDNLSCGEGVVAGTIELLLIALAKRRVTGYLSDRKRWPSAIRVNFL